MESILTKDAILNDHECIFCIFPLILIFSLDRRTLSRYCILRIDSGGSFLGEEDSVLNQYWNCSGRNPNCFGFQPFLLAM